VLSSRSTRNKSGVFAVVISHLFGVSCPLQSVVMPTWELWGAVGRGADQVGSEDVRMLVDLGSLSAERAIFA
jgi:hypothetical protein